MVNLGDFNANDYQSNDAQDFAPIPDGIYPASIIASEMKTTKKGDGKYLELTWQIISGAYANRRIWSRHNIHNPNPEAVKIAMGEVAAICRAVGNMQPRDSSELHNIPMQIRIKLKPDHNGELRSEVKGFLPAATENNEERGNSDDPAPYAR